MEKVEIKIDDALSNQLTNAAVGFLKFRDNGQEADVAGSGTFIQLGKIKGILTAGHVIDNLPTSGEVGLVRPQSALQNMRVDMSHTDRLPRTKKKVVGALLGTVKSTREFSEDGVELVEIGVDYGSSTRSPQSYEGVSGGALWKISTELNGNKVVGVQKKLDGVAFRQSKDNSLVTFNGPKSIASLVEQIKRKWP